MSGAALASLDRILERGGDPDEVLRRVVEVLVGEQEIAWAAIRFVEQGALVLGPEGGEPDPSRRSCVPVCFQGSRVGELVVDGDADRSFLERVAALISPHVLLGWDTGGEAWEP